MNNNNPSHPLQSFRTLAWTLMAIGVISLAIALPVFAGVSSSATGFECRGPAGLISSGITEAPVLAGCQSAADATPASVYTLARIYAVTATPVVLPPPVVPPVTGLPSRIAAFGDRYVADSTRPTPAFKLLAGLLGVPYFVSAQNNGATAVDIVSGVKYWIKDNLDKKAAIYIWNVGNEFYACAYGCTDAQLTSIANTSASNLKSAVQSLLTAGVKDITLLGPRDGGLTPYAVQAGGGAYATHMMEVYDAAAKTKVCTLAVKCVDMMAYSRALYAQYGNAIWYDEMHLSALY